MPTVTVDIAGRTFLVACQEGEEPFLHKAATYLDTEARSLGEQAGRLTESRLLLMSALLLADRTAALEESLRQTQERLSDTEAALSDLQSQPPRLVEVPRVPVASAQLLSELAAEAEALADQLVERVSE